jgi:hypothetical protein
MSRVKLMIHQHAQKAELQESDLHAVSDEEEVHNSPVRRGRHFDSLD